jgi:thioesterase domain-containing protein
LESIKVAVAANLISEPPEADSKVPSVEGSRGEGPLATIREGSPSGSNEETFAFPLSLSQQRYWLFDQMMPGNATLNMPITLGLNGSVDREVLQRSLDELVQRHEVLRTSFEVVSGEPIQLIHTSAKLPIEEVDLRELPAAERASRTEELVRKEAQQPFVLSASPLLRVTFLRLAADEQVLLITLPHIITDGWSNGILIRELAALYDAHARGLPAQLPEIPLQYADYCVWQRDWLKAADLERDLQYWGNKLRGRLPILDLPTDRPTVAALVSHGETEVASLGPDVVDKLKSFCKREEATLFMFFLAVFKTMLFRYSGKEDILVGSPINGRTGGTEGVIGPFASSICLRSDLSGDPAFRELLGRVRDVTVEALEHKDLPFERLTEELDISPVEGRNPLFQIYFLHQVGFLQPTEAGDVSWTPLSWASPGTAFDLHLALLERPDGTAMRLEYRPQQFDAATIQTMLADFRSIIDCVVNDPAVHIADLITRLKHNPRHKLSVVKGHANGHAEWDAAPTLAGRSTVSATQAATAGETRLDSFANGYSEPGKITRLAKGIDDARVVELEDPELDKIKSAVISIWEAAFGRFPIGEDDDFLALGGSSLLAIRLMARINEAFGVNLPPPFLFGFPTAAKLAAELRKTDAKKTPRIVTLQPLGDKPPFFIVGAATRLVALLRQTICGHPIFSLLGDDKVALSGHYALRDEAGEHVKTILETQENGPYLVGGFSAGGIIAYEVTQQLLALGKQVALLVLFDASNPFFMRDYSELSRSLAGLRYTLRFHAANLKKLAVYQRPSYLAKALWAWRPGLAFLKRTFSRRGLSKGSNEADPLMTRIMAARQYRPKPLSNPTLLFKRSSDEFLGRHADPLYGWGNVITGDLDLCVLEGVEHLDIFSGGNGDVVVNKLGHRLREAFDEAPLRPPRRRVARLDHVESEKIASPAALKNEIRQG